jgi:HEAT repeat protein
VPHFLAGFLSVSERLGVAIEIGNVLMGNSNWRARLAFVNVLGPIFGRFSDDSESDVFIEWIQKAAADTELEVRIAVCDQIGDFRLDLGDSLRVLQNDESEEVRLALIRGLIQYHDKELSRAILVSFLPQSAPIALRALKALKKLEPAHQIFSDTIANFLRSTTHWRDRKAVVDALPELGIDSLDLIKLLFHDEAITVRYALIDLLPQVHLRNDDIVELLRDASQSDDYQLRQTAIVAISKLNLWAHATIKPLLRPFATDPVAGVRLALARRLPPAHDLLGLLKSDPDPDVRHLLRSPVSSGAPFSPRL